MKVKKREVSLDDCVMKSGKFKGPFTPTKIRCERERKKKHIKEIMTNILSLFSVNEY